MLQFDLLSINHALEIRENLMVPSMSYFVAPETLPNKLATLE